MKDLNGKIIIQQLFIKIAALQIKRTLETAFQFRKKPNFFWDILSSNYIFLLLRSTPQYANCKWKHYKISYL